MDIRYVAAAAAFSIALPVGFTQAQDAEEREITLVGCVMREADYRALYGPGRSGPQGPGIGGRDEYMMVDAREVTPATPVSTEDVNAPCTGAPGAFPTAFELTGPTEEEVGAFLGQRVEVSGIRKEASVEPVGTTGVVRPTGGFDPLGHELHLYEVEVASVQRATAARAAVVIETPVEPVEAPAPIVEAEPIEREPEIVAEAAPPARAPAPEPAPAPAPEPIQREPDAPRIARQELPRTASPLPLAGLAGLLSLAAAAGVRSLRRG